MNSRKAKVSWSEISRIKQEGGLGIRPLKEMNEVSILKLIWRILSANSLWVKWVQTYLKRNSSIWTVRETALGSWMWKKILKCRDRAKQFYKVEVRNGMKASF